MDKYVRFNILRNIDVVLAYQEAAATGPACGSARPPHPSCDNRATSVSGGSSRTTFLSHGGDSRSCGSVKSLHDDFHLLSAAPRRARMSMLVYGAGDLQVRGLPHN